MVFSLRQDKSVNLVMTVLQSELDDLRSFLDRLSSLSEVRTEGPLSSSVSWIKHISLGQLQVAVVEPIVDGRDCRLYTLGFDHHFWKIFLSHVMDDFLLSGFLNLGFTT